MFDNTGYESKGSTDRAKKNHPVRGFGGRASVLGVLEVGLLDETVGKSGETIGEVVDDILEGFVAVAKRLVTAFDLGVVQKATVGIETPSV